MAVEEPGSDRLQTPHFRRLLQGLREAAGGGHDALARHLDASLERMGDEPAYRADLRAELRALMQATSSTHLLTEVGILSAETIFAGVLRRVGRQLAPAPARIPDLESEVRGLFEPADAIWLATADPGPLQQWFATVLHGAAEWDDQTQLASALVILATRVAGAGLDARLCERMPSLEAWNSPLIGLSRVVDQYAEAYVGGEHAKLSDSTLEAVQRCIDQVLRFRAEKEVLGTTLYLSSASLRMLQQLRRLHLLIECTVDASRPHAITLISQQVARDLSRKRPTLHFLGEKLELIAYLVVGHAAQKGDKYAVRNRSEYWGFWKKSLIGGLVVSVFALLKLRLTHDELAIVPQALLYGANYALCFALIYVFGGTLATKQPALTASRLAESLEEGPGHESFPELVRAIWRSQFVSFLGNIAGAGLCAALFALAFEAIADTAFLRPDGAAELAAKLHPIESATIWYAAVAGVMLSAAGIIAGFVDNAVVFHRVADRVRAGGGLFRPLTPGLRGGLADRIEKHTGALSGNIVLGFMLGSAGAVGVMFGVPFDIRHIAFASSHAALALMYAPGGAALMSVVTLVTSVSLVGLVNFIVSFSLTLGVAVQARQLDGIDWRAGRRAVWRLFRAHPLRFLVPIEGRTDRP